MSILLTVLTFLTPFAAIFFALWAGLHRFTKTGSGKSAMLRHVLTLVCVFGFMSILTLGVSAAEAETAAEATDAAVSAASQIGMGFIAAALSVGLGGLGGGLAIAGGAPAAIGATAEDPKAFGKAMIFVALGEAVALYGFVIAFVILGKLPTITL